MIFETLGLYFWTGEKPNKVGFFPVFFLVEKN